MTYVLRRSNTLGRLEFRYSGLVANHCPAVALEADEKMCPVRTAKCRYDFSVIDGHITMLFTSGFDKIQVAERETSH